MTETGQAFNKTFPVDTSRLKRIVIENPFGSTFVRGWQQSDVRFASDDPRWDGTGLVIDETEEDMIVSTAGLAGRFASSLSWLSTLSSVPPNIASIFDFTGTKPEGDPRVQRKESEEMRKRIQEEMRRAREEMREARRAFRKAWEDARARATAQNEYVSAPSDFDNPDDEMPDPDDFSVRGGARRSGVDFFDSAAFKDVFDSVKQGFNEIGSVFGEIGSSLGSWGAKVGEGFNAPLVIDAPAGIEIIIRSISGDVRIENWDGRVQIDSVSSGAKLRKIAGDVKFASLSGDLKIEDMGGILVARDTSGRIKIRRSNLRGFGVYTTSGSILLETSLAANGKYEIGTVSGQAKVYFPANQSCSIESRTVSGKVTPTGASYSFSLGGGAGKKKAANSDTQRLDINGGGFALVQFRSVSGDLKVGAGNNATEVEAAFRAEEDETPASRESAPQPHTPPPPAPPKPIFRPAPQAPTYTTQPIGPTIPVTPPPPAPRREVPMPGPMVPEPSPNPVPQPIPMPDPLNPTPTIPIPPERPVPPLVPSEPPREDGRAQKRKAILQAIERGDLSVEEGLTLLSATDKPQG